MKRLPLHKRNFCIFCALLFVGLFSIGGLLVSKNAVNAQIYSTEQPEGRHRTLSPYCRELESKLAADWVRGNQSSTLLPELNKKIRKQDKLFNKLRNKGDRMNCYENMFIFGRTLKRTKKCHAIDRKIRCGET